jgi:signal transduction histidine kinase
MTVAFVIGWPVLESAQNVVINAYRSAFAGQGFCDGQIPVLPPPGTYCAPGYRYSVPVRLAFLALVLVVLALAGLACWLAAGRVLRPLSATARTVRQLGPQNLGQRIRMAGAADPLKELADAIDNALDRLASGYEGQRRFAANASHELRTPLAVQRLLTEVAMDDPDSGQDLHKLGAQLLRTNERSERLIEGLLVLAESDRGLPGKVPVRLDNIANSVLDAHEKLAAEHGVSLHRNLGERTVPGDPLLLERLITNLVANAIVYNEPDGWVEVKVGDYPALTVRNSGQAVPAEAVSSLFEPFRRLNADRVNHDGGAGLGLSIVRSITTAHGGTIRALPGLDGGLIIEIVLPAAL